MKQKTYFAIGSFIFHLFLDSLGLLFSMFSGMFSAVVLGVLSGMLSDMNSAVVLGVLSGMLSDMNSAVVPGVLSV